MPYRQQKNRARKQSLLGSESLTMGVLSDDFAAVDVREGYANLSLTEKANSRGAMNGKNKRKKAMRGGKSGSRSPSGLAGTAPRRRAFGLGFRVVLVVFFVACAWLRRAQRAALVYNKHTPRCHSYVFLIFKNLCYVNCFNMKDLTLLSPVIFITNLLYNLLISSGELDNKLHCHPSFHF